MIHTPEQQKALQAVATSSIKVSSALGVPLIEVEEFQQNLLEFIRKNHSTYANQLLYFVLSNSVSGTAVITAKDVTKAALASNALLRVDKELRLIAAEKSPDCMADFADKLNQENNFGVFISKGSYLIEFLRGVLICDFDALNGHKNLPFKGGIISRPMASLDLILEDHKKNRIDNEKGFSYWSDKAKRLLRSDEKHGTEWLFQNDLYWWLSNFLSDKLDVIAEPSGLGQDKHDIRVITTDGLRYVIEIKWLGKNEAKTTYKQPRINEGLQQVKIYLENDSGLYCGYLIVYDGRPDNEHDKESHWDNQFRHQLCEEPRVLFLKSENPSKEAERLVKEAKQ